MALGDGTTWDEATPTDATTATLIDDYNRDLRIGLRSRLALEHEWPASQAATAEGGKHKYLTLQIYDTKQGAFLSGTQVAALYCRSFATTGDALVFLNAATQEVNLSRKSYYWYLDGEASTGTDKSARLRILSDGKILFAQAYCSTTASGGDGIQVDVDYNGSSIWTATSQQLLLAPGSTGTGVSTFVTTNVTAGGTFIIDVDKVGTGIAGGGVTVLVEVG